MRRGARRDRGTIEKVAWAIAGVWVRRDYTLTQLGAMLLLIHHRVSAI